MKLIDAEAAVKIAERYGLSCGSVIGKHSGIADVIASEIDNMERLDPVHAAGGVYCRECKFSEKRDYRYLFCTAVDRHPARWCRYDDFCSHGVKRGAEDDG